MVTDLKRAIDPSLIALGPAADGHPLVVGLPSGLNTLKEIALAFVMVLGPGLPGVVGQLVVILDRDPRVRGVGGEEVRVGAVQAVAHAVVLKH